MSYKDRSFCNFEKCADWEKCPRAATEEVKKAAEECGELICYIDFAPMCLKLNGQFNDGVMGIAGIFWD